MRSAKSVLLLVLITTACSDPISPSSITGKWVEDFVIPGFSWEMDLTLSGSTVSGNGTWCGEAGPCGVVAVTGTIGENEVHLVYAVTAQLPNGGPTSISHFEGLLTSTKSLRGSITAGTPMAPGSPPGQVSYHRE